MLRHAPLRWSDFGGEWWSDFGGCFAELCASCGEAMSSRAAVSGVRSGILARRFPVPTDAEECLRAVDMCKCILFFASLFVDFAFVLRCYCYLCLCCWSRVVRGCIDLARDVDVDFLWWLSG